MLLEEEADAGQDTLEVAHSWGESSMKSSKTQDWRIPMEKGEVFHSNEHLPSSYYTASYSSPCLRLLLSTYMVSSRKVETAYTHYHHRTSVLTKKKIHEKKASLLSVITFVWKNIA